MAALNPAVGEAVCINLIDNVLLTPILSKHAVGKCCFITIGKKFASSREDTKYFSPVCRAEEQANRHAASDATLFNFCAGTTWSS